jgi:hypothetical protein
MILTFHKRCCSHLGDRVLVVILGRFERRRRDVLDASGRTVVLPFDVRAQLFNFPGHPLIVASSLHCALYI